MRTSRLAAVLGTAAIAAFALSGCGSSSTTNEASAAPKTSVAAPTTLPATTTSAAASSTKATLAPSLVAGEPLPTCAPLDSWDTALNGVGISVGLMFQPNPGPITVTVFLKSGSTEEQSRTLSAGQDSPQFDFPKISKSAVERVVVHTTPADACAVQAAVS